MELPVIVFEPPTRADLGRALASPRAWLLGLLLVGAAAAGLWWLARPAEPIVAEGEAPLRVETAPPGATIVVDGRERGRTPATVGVTPGSHELLLRRDGALDERRRVAHLQEAARPEVPRQRWGSYLFATFAQLERGEVGADAWRSLGGEQSGPFLGVLDRCSAAEAQPVGGAEDPAPEPGPQRIELDARGPDAAPGAEASV